MNCLKCINVVLDESIFSCTKLLCICLKEIITMARIIYSQDLLKVMWLALFRGGNASLASLVDTPHQTRVVELLIVHAESLFGPREDHQLITAETPVEPLEKRNVLQVPQTATIGEYWTCILTNIT